MDNYNHISDPVRTFFAHVFGWMSVGLTLTGCTSWYIFYQQPELLQYVVESRFFLMGLFIVQLGLVVWFSSSLMRMSFSTALTVFLLYAVLNGIIFSGIFFTYTQESIATTFGSAAATFFVMALVGYTTRSNLTPIGVWGSMVLIGLIISTLVNFYFQNGFLQMIFSGIGVVLFSAFTAYDMQKLRLLSEDMQYGRGHEMRYHVALMGALTLYLDFINLFLMLLSFTGKRRD